jgi:hypothetical protein
MPLSTAEEFAEELKIRCDLVGRHPLAIRQGSSGRLFINFYNVPQGITAGSALENNRIMLDVTGLADKNGKIRVEGAVRGPAYGVAFKLRTKTTTFWSAVTYCADYINRCAQQEPRIARYERNASKDNMRKNSSLEDADSRVRFRVGDRVCFIDNDPRHHDKVGEIIRVGNYVGEFSRHQTRYWIRADDGSEFTSGDKRLRLATGHSRNGPILARDRNRTEADEVAARELSLYIENEYSLVGAPNSKGKAIERNLLRKLQNGTFNLALSEKAWMYLMEAGAKKYSKEFSDGRDWATMFNKATRELVAHEFATTFYDEHKGSMSRNSDQSFTVEEFDAPAHWASAFINGDTSGLEEEDLADFEAWCAKHPDLGWVVDVSEEAHLGRWHGLQTDLATYTAHVR